MDNITVPDIKILCCNYFNQFDVWNYKNVTRGYWQFYWNETPGAYILFEDNKIELTSDIFALVPPYTNFSTYCTCKFNHMYLHFTTGEPYNAIERKVFTFNAKESLRIDIKSFKSKLISMKKYDHKENLLVYSLIFDALLNIDECYFSNKSRLDPRIKEVTDLIHQHFSESLSNEEICEKLKMSQTNLIRLFRTELGITPQKYLKFVKMEKATYMLCYTELSIEEIANKTGFTDRYHFSKVFKQQRGKSPAIYRKHFAGL